MRKYREEIINNITRVKPTDWLRRNLSLIGLYYHLCNYGEDYYLPVVWAFEIILFSTLYWWVKLQLNLEPSISCEGLGCVGEAFGRSATAFAQLRTEFWEDYVIRIAAIPVLGTLFVALRRRVSSNQV